MSFSKIRGNKALGKLSVLHKVTGMNIYLCLLGVHFPFFGKSPLNILLGSDIPHAQAMVWAGLMPSPSSRGKECPFHTASLQPHQERFKEDHVTWPMGCISRNFVRAEKEQVCPLVLLEAGMIQVWKF